MKVLILGGDGFCGWPTSLHLSNLGHEVVVVDNLSRRNIDNQLETESLTPISTMGVRIGAWKELTGREIHFENIDAAKEYGRLLELINTEKPDAIVHFAEQRAAPYSMKSSANKRYTVDNNTNATHNLLVAVVESGLDIHVVHLGTMGVYGYGTAGMKIPEGYLDVEVTTDAGERVEQSILYPTNPGSVYHMTKTLDQLLFAYYAKNDELRITDLHQGIVWGTNTPETAMDERLINRFDYDGDYGTVLNRFLVQAAVGHPITVHGTGGQTRAFMKILNQMTQTHRVRDLASLISSLTGAEVANVSNPRKEDAENDLHVRNDLFIDLGLAPTLLNEGLLLEVSDVASRYRHRADHSKIPARSTWTANQQPGVPEAETAAG